MNGNFVLTYIYVHFNTGPASGGFCCIRLSPSFKWGLVLSAQLKQLWQQLQPSLSSALLLYTPRFGGILMFSTADPVQLC